MGRKPPLGVPHGLDALFECGVLARHQLTGSHVERGGCPVKEADEEVGEELLGAKVRGHLLGDDFHLRFAVNDLDLRIVFLSAVLLLGLRPYSSRLAAVVRWPALSAKGVSPFLRLLVERARGRKTRSTSAEGLLRAGR